MNTGASGTSITGTITIPNGGWISAATGTATINQYSTPSLLETKVNEDSIELVYQEEPLLSTWPQTTFRRVFKVVYSCINGKWNASERIYGHVVPAQDESYEFDV